MSKPNRLLLFYDLQNQIIKSRYQNITIILKMN